jgi:tellurite resistance protein TehA-like permease
MIYDLMKPIAHTSPRCKRNASTRWMAGALLLPLLLSQSYAHASMFKGEALDSIADVMSWVVLIIAPLAAIAVFLMVHILPEKIAEKKQHPQTDAIKTLCLLSLFFGGMLWPLAWLWAYSKPVMYKLAYGTDKLVHGQDDAGVSAEDSTDEVKKA